MKLKVNGEDYETGQQTMAGLMEELKILPHRVAVEINLKVIKRADVPGHCLRDGDVVEIVNFVGGGGLYGR